MTSRYSPGLLKKLTELNGGYQPDFFSIGRLVTMIGNPYGVYPGISEHNKEEIVKIIRGTKKDHDRNSLSKESFDVAYTFINTLLLKKHSMSLPYFPEENSFKRVNTYKEFLEDLVHMRKSTSSTCAKDNIEVFLRSQKGGFFRGRLEEQLIMKSYEPTLGPIVRVSFRTKTRQSFVEKSLERFIRLDREIVQKTYLIPEIGKEITGKEIFMEYFRRFKSSGLDLYEFYSRENPQYLRGENLEKFKERFIGIFPIDHDGGKIIVKTIKDAHYLAEDFFNSQISNYAGFPIHMRLCENNVKCEHKDGSYTLGVGGMMTHSGMTEIKIQHSSAVIESEFGKSMHLTYKGEKEKELKKLLHEHKDYAQYYLNLCRAFKIEPRLLEITPKKSRNSKLLNTK